jgi:cell division protease FtsH
MQVEATEKNLITRSEVLNKITTYCGGRAAEELVFGEYTTGASNDIEQATKIARAMVTKYGMTEKFGMMGLETGGNNYLGQESQLTCSSETARIVDEETLSIIKQAHADARQILQENETKLHELSKFLIEKETITGEEFMKIMNA